MTEKPSTVRPPAPGTDMAYEMRELRLAMLALGETIATGVQKMERLDRSLGSMLLIVSRLERRLDNHEARISDLEAAE